MLPERCRQLAPYIKLAEDLHDTMPIASFFLHKFVTESAFELKEGDSDTEINGFMAAQMNLAAEVKPAGLTRDERVSAMQQICSRIFETAENADLDGNLTASTVKQYFTAALLFDALGKDIIAVDDERRRFAKQKALYIRKCIAQGIHPKSGILDVEDLQRVGIRAAVVMRGDNYDEQPKPPRSIVVPDVPVAPAELQSSDTCDRIRDSNSSYVNVKRPEEPEEPADYGRMMDTARVIDKARRNAEFAISALNFGTRNEAIRYLEDALSNLKSLDPC